MIVFGLLAASNEMSTKSPGGGEGEICQACHSWSLLVCAMAEMEDCISFQTRLNFTVKSK